MGKTKVSHDKKVSLHSDRNSLISGCGTKTSTFLMLLKETAMRSGEAKRLEWINIDTEKNLVTLNDPEKRSNPRMWKVSPELVAMLNMLPKTSVKVFGDGPINSMKSTFIKTRKRLALASSRRNKHCKQQLLRWHCNSYKSRRH